jgi:membrane protein YqaA with SNARE-associated domain
MKVKNKEEDRVYERNSDDSTGLSEPGQAEPGRRNAAIFLRDNRLLIARLVALVVVIGLSLLIFSIRDRAEEFAIYGYPGIFLISFLAYATVLLPAPGVLVVFTMGAVFHPLGVALAAGAGAAFGEFSGYLAGFSSQLVIERAEVYERLTQWMQRNGPLTVLILSAIPNPFFDLAGIAAGALKMHPLRFLFWVWIGVTLKMLAFAYTGAAFLGRT